MSSKTGIDWTDSTWNPIRGCTPVSPGCKNCYAAKDAKRFSFPGGPYEGLVRINAAGKRTDDWNGNIRFVEKHLLDPLRWKPVLTGIRAGEGQLTTKEHRDGTVSGTRPRRIFVNSMSDLFHENVTDEMRDRIFSVMALCPQHIFQVLTKRPERMREYMTGEHATANGEMGTAKGECALAFGRPARFFPQAFKRLPLNQDVMRMKWPLPNVWLGVSVENQAAADERIPLLLQTPAAVRFISAEPLLGPVSIHRWLISLTDRWPGMDFGEEVIPGRRWKVPPAAKLDWVICGGESGPGARPMHPDWARSLRDQCRAAAMPFFFKQWGEWVEGMPDQSEVLYTDEHPIPHGPNNCFVSAAGRIARNEEEMHDRTPYHWMSRVGKKSAGALLDGREWKQFPADKTPTK